MLDLIGGRGGTQIVLYPARNQESVPCAGFDRLPGQQARLGYPISATFPRQLKVLGGRGTLTDAEGNAIETLLSTPERPLDPGVPCATACACIRAHRCGRGRRTA